MVAIVEVLVQLIFELVFGERGGAFRRWRRRRRRWRRPRRFRRRS